MSLCPTTRSGVSAGQTRRNAKSSADKAAYCAASYGVSSAPSSSMPIEKSLQALRPCHQEVGGHAQRLDAGKEWVGVGRQVAAEQPIDPRAAELAGRQADAVDHHELGLLARRPQVVVRAQHLTDTAQQAGGGIELEGRGVGHGHR
jgi:hypothetical protein